MKAPETLHELLVLDPESKAMYDSLSREVQVSLQEQRQNIRSREALAKAAAGFEKRRPG